MDPAWFGNFWTAWSASVVVAFFLGFKIGELQGRIRSR